tara:strand:+ start:931 stop:1368 length:438 start_codon:yes stop_codon:yes gene_type:complete
VPSGNSVNPVDAIGSRREARETALGILYAADVQSRDLHAFLDERPVKPPEYAVDLVSGIADVLGELDDLVGRFAEGWATDRMSVVDRALARIAVFELLYRPDVPTAAVLSEVVELASEYSTDRSPRFVNGVAAAVAKEVRTDTDQ